MPVQRLPRYLLLLDELRKNTGHSDPSYDDIVQAHEKIQKMAKDINESLRFQDGTRKVQAIQDKFERDKRFMDLVSPTRVLVKDGVLAKKFGKMSRHLTSWQEYHFFLFNDILVYAAKTLLGTYKLKHVVPVMNMEVKPVRNDKSEPLNLEIKSRGGKSFTVAAGSGDERDVWYEAFKQAIKLSNPNEVDDIGDGLSNKKQSQKSTSKLAAMMGVGK